GALAVAQPVDGYQARHLALVRGQAADRAPGPGQRHPILRRALAIPTRMAGEHRGVHALLEPALLTHAVDPNRLHDAIHPTVEPATRLKLIGALQRPLAGRLHEVIAFLERA